MKIGFTGSRKYPTSLQLMVLAEVISQACADGYEELHHGCCVGADEVANGIARAFMLRTVGHPPTDTKLMARARNMTLDETRDPFPYLERNRHIVDETDMLIAVPDSRTERLRSGTWSTVRYAKKQGKPIIYVYPSGRTE